LTDAGTEEPLPVAVLVSGSGTNLQALLDRFNLGASREAEVVAVVGSRPGIRALDRARSADVPTAAVEEPDTEGRRLGELLERSGAKLVVLAGYLRKISPPVVRSWRGRMVNIHPALLPSFGGAGMYGERVHEAVLASGARVTGVTVHFVDEAYDEGAIVAQWPVPVLEDDDADALAARVLEVEHWLLPEVVTAYARDEFRLTDDGRAEWMDERFAGDRFVMEEDDDRTGG
jgi:formyltetrahydrofolate-dependent phosphoribosylglycinamide formyltransferase